MVYAVRFTSISELIVDVTASIEQGKLKDNGRLRIIIDAKSRSLIYLYSIGRLISFSHYLYFEKKVQTTFFFDYQRKSKAIKHLISLGFFKFCDEEIYLRYDFKKPIDVKIIQKSLFRNIDLSLGKTYWHCLLPISKFKIESTNHENTAFKNTNDILDNVSSLLSDKINEEFIKLKVKDVLYEINQILFEILYELVLNSIMHSSSGYIQIAITIDRENSTSDRVPAKLFEPGLDKYNILIMDFSETVLHTVSKTINEDANPPHESNDKFYNSMKSYNRNFTLQKIKEESILQNVFKGNFSIRKGRRSEGLKKIANSVHSFQGLLNYRSGRTETQVFTDETGTLKVKTRKKNDISTGLHGIKDIKQKSYYLPGVIASFILTSYQLKLFVTKELCKKEIVTKPPEIAIEEINKLPKAIYARLSGNDLKRQSELIASELFTIYSNASTKHKNIPCFLEIDLFNSLSVNVNSLDYLIQEFVKYQNKNERLISKIIFTNVNKRIIYELKKRSCNSLLIAASLIAVLIDETDSPHFLGISKTTDNIYDVEFLLLYITMSGKRSENEIVQVLASARHSREREILITYLEEIISEDHRMIFYREKTSSGKTIYNCHNYYQALDKNRHFHVKGLDECYLSIKDNIIMLQNGEYLKGIIQFSEFWGSSTQKKRLFDSAKLILKNNDIPYANTIISFTNNGDKLSHVFQRYLHISKLIIIDPVYKNNWETVDIDSNYGIITNVLYPGDENGFIKEFVQTVFNKEVQYKVLYILTYISFLGNESLQILLGEKHVKIRVISLYSISNDSFLEQYYKKSDLINSPSVFKTNEQHLSPDIYQIGNNKVESNPNLATLKSSIKHKYSMVELSSEFWHNASTLEIISPIQKGKEKRNVLFFENNEKVIEHSRTRKYLEENLISFIKDRLDYKIDIILHPTHPVGYFMAQCISSHLNKTPLILPMSQREYGGKIEMTTDRYLDYSKQILNYRRELSKFDLKAIIIDDSILTGTSIFTMLGISKKLGLDVTGIFVLMNRLTPEVSASYDNQNFIFSYLYRLHIPIESKEQSHITLLMNINKGLMDETNSFFSNYWCNFIEQTSKEYDFTTNSYFTFDKEKIDKLFMEDRISDKDYNFDYGKYVEFNIRKQIIENLLLHPNNKILDFYTRLAVVFNFLDPLTSVPDVKNEKNPFWDFLTQLTQNGIKEKQESWKLHFVRKVIFLIIFSRHIREIKRFVRFKIMCHEILQICFQNKENSYQNSENLICECFMALGIIGDEKLIALFKEIHPVLNSLNRNLEVTYAPDLNIISSYTWSMHTLFKNPEIKKFIKPSMFKLIQGYFNDSSEDGNEQLYLLELFFPLLEDDHFLLNKLGITHDPGRVKALELLDKKDVKHYLTEAPGYTFTLKYVLRLCKADIVILYSRKKNTIQYNLLAFEINGSQIPIKNLSAIDLNNSTYPSFLERRMDKGISFFSTKKYDLAFLNKFTQGDDYEWMMGSKIRDKNGGEQYYAIIGFYKRGNDRVNRAWDDQFLRTSYYYWLKYEKHLNTILPKLNLKYSDSQATWNILQKAMNTIHDHKKKDNNRAVLSIAMGLIGVEKLLKKILSITFQQSLPLETVSKNISELINELEKKKRRAQEIVKDETFFNMPFHVDKQEVQIRFKSLKYNYPKTVKYITFYYPVLEFVLYECLQNALAYSKEYIDVILEFNPSEDGFVQLNLKIVNDFFAVPENRESQGIIACKNAINAISGRFDVSESSKLWMVTICINTYLVPMKMSEVIDEEVF
jgi:adenine/guanine phosphoribosyltransferase-like PRPP-binding protein